MKLALCVLALVSAIGALPLDDPRGIRISKPVITAEYHWYSMEHGTKQPGDRQKEVYGAQLNVALDNRLILKVEPNEVITHCQFAYTSGDRKNSSMVVIDGGEGRNFIEFEFTSETNRVYYTGTLNYK